MAIFQREGSLESKDIETIIGPTVHVDGNFTGAGDVVVEGQVSGTLKTSKNLRIGEQAIIKADIEASNITVGGEIRGHVNCLGRIEILPTGKIFGNVDTKTIAVAHGAVLHGKITMSGHEVPKTENGK